MDEVRLELGICMIAAVVKKAVAWVLLENL